MFMGLIRGILRKSGKIQSARQKSKEIVGKFLHLSVHVCFSFFFFVVVVVCFCLNIIFVLLLLFMLLPSFVLTQWSSSLTTLFVLAGWLIRLLVVTIVSQTQIKKKFKNFPIVVYNNQNEAKQCNATQRDASLAWQLQPDGSFVRSLFRSFIIINVTVMWWAFVKCRAQQKQTSVSQAQTFSGKIISRHPNPIPSNKADT